MLRKKKEIKGRRGRACPIVMLIDKPSSRLFSRVLNLLFIGGLNRVCRAIGCAFGPGMRFFFGKVSRYVVVLG